MNDQFHGITRRKCSQTNFAAAAAVFESRWLIKQQVQIFDVIDNNLLNSPQSDPFYSSVINFLLFTTDCLRLWGQVKVQYK